MSGYHGVAARGDVSPEALIRAVYGLDPDEAVEAAGTGDFPWGADTGLVGVTATAGWTVVIGGFPPGLGDDAEALAELSRGRAVFRWMVQTTSGSAGFDLFDGGEHRRAFLSVEGEVVYAEGAPLPGEPEGGCEAVDQGEVDEWSFAPVFEALVGPWDPVGQAEYRLYRFSPA